MKASLFLGVASAAMALAGPINRRALETEWVVEIVTVTVTAGQESAAGVFIEKPTHHRPGPTRVRPISVRPTSVFVPKPTTTVIIPPPVETSQEPVPEPEPEPTTSEAAPEPAPTTSEPAPEPTPDEPSGLGEYEDLMLHHHNIHRANHSAPALSWDATLATYASNTAKGCVFEHDMDQGSGGYGQNLASWGSSGDISSQQLETGAGAITNQWYNGEVNAWTFYGSANPPKGANLLEWGHFTQVVWKSSTKVGCATVQCPAGTVLGLPAWYTVCNYNPPGK